MEEKKTWRSQKMKKTESGVKNSIKVQVYYGKKTLLNCMQSVIKIHKNS